MAFNKFKTSNNYNDDDEELIFDAELRPKLKVSFDDKIYYEKIISKYVALNDFRRNCNDELDMLKDDFFIPLEPITEIEENYGWILAQNLITKNIGYVPTSYLIHIDDYFKLQPSDWYFPNITRKDSEKLLKNRSNGVGSYLVRESKDKDGILILSVLTYDESNNRIVLHYLIKINENREFFIYDTHKFNSIDKLIEFYSFINGLCEKLTIPCVRNKLVRKFR